MHNLVAISIFLLSIFLGLALLMAGLGIYYWGKAKSEHENKN